MPFIVRRGSFRESESRTISPSENVLTRLATGIMGGSTLASTIGISFGWKAGILGAVIGLVLGLCKPPGKKGIPYDSLWESILTRLIFGTMAGATGGLGAWFWSGGYIPGNISWTPVIIGAGVGFLVGLLLGDEIPSEWLRPF